jgi:hypothetical protein
MVVISSSAEWEMSLPPKSALKNVPRSAAETVFLNTVTHTPWSGQRDPQDTPVPGGVPVRCRRLVRQACERRRRPQRPSPQRTDLFKTLTGGDRISGEKKYHDAFDFLSFATLMFSANEAPMWSACGVGLLVGGPLRG